MSAEQHLPDFDDLLAELARLEIEEARISAVRRRLHDQLDLGFPNDLVRRRERQVSDERRALHRRIDVLRAQVAPVLRRQLTDA
jgi:hypothetical protein